MTSRQLRERLERELKSNVALRVAPTDDDTVFEVSGRGELHLTILIENMRREGYELAVSRPRVVYKTIDGVRHEPYEALTVDVDEAHVRAVSWKNWDAVAASCRTCSPTPRDVSGWNTGFPPRGLIGFQE